jgi:DNA-binding CsgD family transcriptional regulator
MKTEHWTQPLADDGARSILNHPINFGDTLHHPSIIRHRVRRKRHLAWEQAELASGGLYARNFKEIAHRYPTLTPMEMRVSALVKSMLPSWKIAEMLCIKEESVERYRCRIRRKLGIHGGWLQQYLTTV